MSHGVLIGAGVGLLALLGAGLAMPGNGATEAVIQIARDALPLAGLIGASMLVLPVSRRLRLGAAIAQLPSRVKATSPVLGLVLLGSALAAMLVLGPSARLGIVPAGLAMAGMCLVCASVGGRSGCRLRLGGETADPREVSGIDGQGNRARAA